MAFVMMRSTSALQSRNADVAYTVGHSRFTPLHFGAGEQIVLQAARSKSLQAALSQAQRQWQKLVDRT